MGLWDNDETSTLEAKEKLRQKQQAQQTENGLEELDIFGNPKNTNATSGNADWQAQGGDFQTGNDQSWNNAGSDWKGMSNGGIAPTQAPQNQPLNNNQVHRDTGEILFDATTKGIKQLSKFLLELVPYFLRLFKEPKLKKNFFKLLLIYFGTFSIFLFLFNFMVGRMIIDVVIESLFFLGVSTVCWYINYSLNADEYTKEDESETTPENFNNTQEEVLEETNKNAFDWVSEENTSDVEDEYEDEYDDEDDYDEYEDDDDIYDDEEEDDWDVSENPIAGVSKQVSAPNGKITLGDFLNSADEGKSVLNLPDQQAVSREVLSSLANVPTSLVSRKLLLDKYLSMLDSGSIKANFTRTISISGDEGIKFIALIQRAQLAADSKTEDEDLVSAVSMLERTMTYEVVVSRNGLSVAKVNAINEELTNILQYNEGQRNPDTYSKMDVVADKIYVTIFKGRNSIVYLKDVILDNRDFFEDEKNIIPVVYGFDENGDSIVADATKEYTMLFFGEMRSGKSNASKAIVNQMIALNSPNKVQFVVGDSKDGISDWSQYTTPHFRRFETSPQGIVNMLHWVVDVEEPRRTKLLSAEKHLNIKSYNEAHPENQLPYLYVILDEMLTFGETAPKELVSEYQSMISVIVSKMAAEGIFGLFIPHRIVNNIISKNASTLISTRFGFKLPSTVIKDNFGVSKKEFPYELKNMGDFAFTLASKKTPSFGHAPLIMENDNRTLNLLNLQRDMWLELEPDSLEGSVYERENRANKQLETLNKAMGTLSDEEEDWLKDKLRE